MYASVPIFNQQIDKLIDRLLATKGNFGNGRMEIFENFSDHLWNYSLIGIGYGMSYYVTGKTIHFPIIAGLIEMGIFGFVSVLFQYAYLGAKSLKIMKKNRKFDGLAAISLVIILGDMMQPNPNYLFTWFAIILGAIDIKDSCSGEDSPCREGVKRQY